MRNLLKPIALMAGGTILALSLSTTAFAQKTAVATIIVIQGDKALMVSDVKTTNLNIILSLLKKYEIKQGEEPIDREKMGCAPLTIGVREACLDLHLAGYSLVLCRQVNRSVEPAGEAPPLRFQLPRPG